MVLLTRFSRARPPPPHRDRAPPPPPSALTAHHALVLLSVIFLITSAILTSASTSASARAAAAEARAVAAEAHAASAAAAAAAAEARPPPRPTSPRAAWPSPRASPYSSFHCLGGVQDFGAMPFALQGTHRPRFPAADEPFMRMCLLRNVCLVGPDLELTYYEDPALAHAVPPHVRMGAFGSGGTSPPLVLTGYLQAQFTSNFAPGRRYDKGGLTPTVIVGPRPTHLPFAPSSVTGTPDAPAVHMLGMLSFPSNWGHLFVDTILPTLAAAEVWGFSVDEVQPLNFLTCAQTVSSDMRALGGTLSHKEMCETNVERWLTPTFRHPLLAGAPMLTDTCFSQLIIGHEAPLSLKGLYHHRAAAVRTLRSRLASAFALLPQEDGHAISTHEIVVLVKTAYDNPPALPRLCDLVRVGAAALSQGGSEGRSPIPVTCIEPSLLDARAQMVALSNATLVVAENGSTGYAALLQVPGTSFLSVLVGTGKDDAAKEVQVLLYLADVSVYYDVEAGVTPGLLHAVLEGVGARLGLEAVGYISSASEARDQSARSS